MKIIDIICFLYVAIIIFGYIYSVLAVIKAKRSPVFPWDREPIGKDIIRLIGYIAILGWSLIKLVVLIIKLC